MTETATKNETQQTTTQQKAQYVSPMYHKGVKYAVLLKGETYLVYSKDHERISSGQTKESAVKRAHAKLYEKAEKEAPEQPEANTLNTQIAERVQQMSRMSPERAKKAFATWMQQYADSDHELLNEHQAVVAYAFIERLSAA